MTNFDKMLRNWFRENDLENIKVCEDVDFYADTTEEIVYYGFEHDDASMMVYDLAKELGMSIDCGIFVLSLLHEVGHIMTDDEWSDEESDFFEYERDICCEMEDMIAAQARYIRIGDELTATQWAVDFINAHGEQVLLLKAKVDSYVNQVEHTA